MDNGTKSPLTQQERLDRPPNEEVVEGQGKAARKERKSRAEAKLDAVNAAIQKEIERSTTKEAFKEARKKGFPVVQKILETRDKVMRIQESVLEESIYSSIGLITRVKQKALSGILEWLEEFVEDKERLLTLTPTQAKTLLSIAYTADQMGRLELGKSTSNVAIAHKTSQAEETGLLQQAVDKLKEVDPVFDYDKVQIKPIELLPDVKKECGILQEGAGGGTEIRALGIQHDDSGTRHDDGGPLSQD